MSSTTPQRPAFDIFDIITYGTVAGGYLLSIIGANHLTVVGFGALTAVNLAWVYVYHQAAACETTEPRRVWRLALLLALACLGMLSTSLGVNFDWLMAFVTVGVLASLLPTRQTLWFSATLLGATAAILARLNHGFNAQLAQDLASIVPGFLFVAGFSHMMQQQSVQRERAETLATEAAAARADLEVAHAQLQAYADGVEELTVTRERNRMAREIHDTLGHYLTILALKLETATKFAERDDPRLHAELTEARRVATECLAEVRHSVAALRPADPTARSFAEALRQLVGEFTATAPQTEVTLDAEGALQTLPTEARLTLYRATQEALTNIRKHAQATKVLLRLRVEGDAVELSILDNGIGASAATDGHEPGFGLVGMRERVALLGGTAISQPVTGQGWRVDVSLPLREPLAATPLPPITARPVSALAEE